MRGTYLAMVAACVALVLVPAGADAAGRKTRKPSTTTQAGATGSKRRAAAKERKAGSADAGRMGKRHVAASTGRARGERRRATDERDDPVPSRPRAGVLTPLARIIHCPPEMVAVAGRVCVDRFELGLVSRDSEVVWSPFFPPDPARARRIATFYEELRERESAPWLGALLPVPPVPSGWADGPAFRAISERGIVPQGHLSADEADSSCRTAGKRLCTESEWLTACRGETGTDFPYGATYRKDACNVYRESHPSWLLHGNAARYHDDPRNNLVATDDGPLLRKTGATPACASRWGDDAIFDMVGNLDEWVADPQGVFAGGFYSRPNKAGCFARVSNHPRAYADYSTGARCCADPLADG